MASSRSPETILTPRLRLRRFLPVPSDPFSDASPTNWQRDRDFFIAMRRGPDYVYNSYTGKGDETEDATIAWLRKKQHTTWAYVIEQRDATTEGSTCGTLQQQSAVLVGGVSIVLPAETHSDHRCPQPELGYSVRSDFAGRGFATEAARALVTAFFRLHAGSEIHDQALCVEATAAGNNVASHRVLQKCGFKYVLTRERNHYSAAQHAWLDLVLWRRNMWTSLDQDVLAESAWWQYCYEFRPRGRCES